MEAVLSEQGLMAWGRRIGAEARVPLMVALRGDLGAGKSTLARAVAQGAGVEGDVPSPTFNLVFRYDTPRGVQVHHLDLYRLEHPDEVWELGWSELGAGDDLVLIEWPQRAEALLPVPRWEIELEEGADPSVRRVTARAVGNPPPLPAFPGGAS
ncbi:tRNA (adenosine(37)-N6)-threonylcarbamoyltransferase complex ATPase subunit type 1 TsaE [Longimicrobium sp.]|uniref:tRNA (adenosine(37)-N6)-threonylcarbamoyltransferase complex ATPase subunit type 1 TsaE n=1 Tax=Longimicrobium sp. TaxID=2029185 RepID=UPI002E3354BD|nr:tRNA (adenosine(37)-N6)-threonylcarbamoyltransferase complex ATPase subunit type 1 TsaE [Longimicrobium sp.]HEX6039041.1 tRNA (adenosine(37)-N6)-threonylcarbamoyltransferase complex ATPase subunit type 1 TsaE [Longimicrobium sp.]